MGGRNSRSFVEQRRERLVSILAERGRASVVELAERLEASPITIRRDLSELEERGVLMRRYGEAVLLPCDGTASTEACRQAIARAAAELVSDDELVFINTSSTALALIPHLRASGVSVVTNSVLAQNLPAPPGGTLFVTGGEIRPPRGVLSGDFALANVRRVSAATCFVGCAGISLTAGVTSTTQQEAEVNSLMVNRSDRMVLLADSSKLGIGAGFTYAPLSRVALLITDAGATDEDVSILREAGVHEVMRVGSAAR
ncbi:MAG: DeoR/GlpR family DNA-binding transcription regulator [Atopobiaceae bacterium]|nr:DeoR/GlpR family DNA-binding transcription regulator [Atopobiaceae bacterium]